MMTNMMRIMRRFVMSVMIRMMIFYLAAYHVIKMIWTFVCL